MYEIKSKIDRPAALQDAWRPIFLTKAHIRRQKATRSYYQVVDSYSISRQAERDYANKTHLEQLQGIVT